MVSSLDVLVWCLAAVGQVVLSVVVNNSVYATNLRWSTIAVLRYVSVCEFGTAVLAAIVWIWTHGGGISQQITSGQVPWPAALYLGLCISLTLSIIPRAILRRALERRPAALLSNHSEFIDVAAEIGHVPAGPGLHGWMVRWPRNESLRLEINQKELQIAGLDPRLDGLSIAHLSDIHFTGHIEQPFFHYVIDRALAMKAELIAVTGDLVDTPRCFDWIGEILGRLHAPLGVYVILGNHDRRFHPVSQLRERITAAGLTDLGGEWRSLEHQGVPLVIAGNEQPWFPAADVSQLPPPRSAGGPLRILFTHTPDQYRWARKHQFDLVLAGHMHGGQIRLPFYGALVGPSFYGTRYAGGTYHEPPSVMHVSRGVSAFDPIRLNCMPEISRLVLRAAPAST